MVITSYQRLLEENQSFAPTYHAGASTDNERLLICLVVIAERGMEGGLKTPVSRCNAEVEVAAMAEQTGKTRLMTLRLSRQALICVTVLL